MNYFFIEQSDPDLDEILTHCVTSNLATQAKLWDDSYLVKIGGLIPDMLLTYASYSHSAMIVERQIRELGRVDS